MPAVLFLTETLDCLRLYHFAVQEDQSQAVSQVPSVRQLLAQLPLHMGPKDRAVTQKVVSDLLHRWVYRAAGQAITHKVMSNMLQRCIRSSQPKVRSLP